MASNGGKDDDRSPRVRVHTRSIEQVLSPIAEKVRHSGYRRRRQREGEGGREREGG